MLEIGEIDAIFSATKPSCVNRSAHCTYLFPNFKSVEAEYYERTKIFPIMHVIAIKRSVFNANPWIARTLQKAFEEALKIGYEVLQERAALRYMLPWLEEHVRETETLLGDSKYWKDGFEENKHVIDRFLEYSHKQGLAKRRFEAQELFAPNTLESFVV